MPTTYDDVVMYKLLSLYISYWDCTVARHFMLVILNNFSFIQQCLLVSTFFTVNNVFFVRDVQTIDNFCPPAANCLHGHVKSKLDGKEEGEGMGLTAMFGVGSSPASTYHKATSTFAKTHSSRARKLSLSHNTFNLLIWTVKVLHQKKKCLPLENKFDVCVGPCTRPCAIVHYNFWLVLAKHGGTWSRDTQGALHWDTT